MNIKKYNMFANEYVLYSDAKKEFDKQEELIASWIKAYDDSVTSLVRDVNVMRDLLSVVNDKLIISVLINIALTLIIAALAVKCLGAWL